MGEKERRTKKEEKNRDTHISYGLGKKEKKIRNDDGDDF